MQILKKITPYSVRGILPALGIAAGAMVMGACSKDDDYIPTDPDKTATFVWGPSYSAKTLCPLIEEAAKNPNIKQLIFESDGEFLGGAVNPSEIFTYMLDPMIASAGKKPIRHQGTLNRVFMSGTNTTEEQYQQFRRDSTRLANMGYVFYNAYNKRYESR